MTESNFYIFVLGFDLLRDRLGADAACDIAFDRAHKVWEQFCGTTLEDEELYSPYENLQRFVENTVFEWEIEETQASNVEPCCANCDWFKLKDQYGGLCNFAGGNYYRVYQGNKDSCRYFE